VCYLFGSFPLCSNFSNKTILPGESAVEPTSKSADACSVVTIVTSHATGLSLCHGISVTLSGRLPSVRDHPGGCFADGIPDIKMATILGHSESAWCPGIRHVASLEEIPRIP
jgi:hypothetical protein